MTTRTRTHYVFGTHKHAKGGRTVLENGVLVHTECHPKGQAAIDFAANFKVNGQPSDGNAV